jgi:anaerobic ribonucleoside-triphosphate reductase activating protein
VIAAHARIHAVEPRSRANGPGIRFVVWFQGCTLGCPGCFNPATHAVAPAVVPAPGTFPGTSGTPGSPGSPKETSIAELAAAMAAACASGATGLSLSGGEPLQQPEAARALLDAARALGLSTLAFSGYTIDEIRALPGGPDVLARLDVLIDGRYVAGERLATGLRGSANQHIHLLTDRHSLAEVEATPVAEIRIGPTGEVVLTGVNPLKLKQRP